MQIYAIFTGLERIILLKYVIVPDKSPRISPHSLHLYALRQTFPDFLLWNYFFNCLLDKGFSPIFADEIQK